MTGSPYLRAALLGLISVAQFTLAEDLGPNIFVRIKNPHLDVRQVQVFDHICERMVLNGPLGSRHSKDVELCSHMGRGEITVVNLRSGKREHHRDVLGGMWFATP